MNAISNLPAAPAISVFSGELGGREQLLVDARGLHKFLGNKRKFTDWIVQRITQYDFMQNKDFLVFHNFVNVSQKPPVVEYRLSLDMAKELAMLERSPKGREVRRYFIDCENRLREQLALPAKNRVARHFWLSNKPKISAEQVAELQALVYEKFFAEPPSWVWRKIYRVCKVAALSDIAPDDFAKAMKIAQDLPDLSQAPEQILATLLREKALIIKNEGGVLRASLI